MEKIFEVVRLTQEIRDLEAPYVKFTLNGPEQVAKMATHFIGDEDREVLLVMLLNIKNKVIGLHRCHVGSLNSSVVHPREVFKVAIMSNAASIIVSHNHPSGDTEPSAQDVEVTKRLREAGLILGIELLDHIIVTYSGDYVSLREIGYI
ncbi:JAB domain-containing protein [Shouchella clausii]|uniref:JAB domain-containing protein n=1 Tax=Shouchella TaxID=2893057 RepID=UPI0004E656CD|nr:MULTISPECIES: JAB domain-containing protein [Shouchella]ALA55232.1 DNA repair protein RadC [Shouchella clausii]MBU3266276.1 DNA repair protein RadC [Shouchella clausii]MBU3509369.1 DNA repair protein RadC [Shouchella clausii]MDP0462090.1 JAB domain-containing protein [Shouchella rhizosphaerae]MDP5267723.1 JAB domain-containing protein [Shouchella clausii]